MFFFASTHVQSIPKHYTGNPFLHYMLLQPQRIATAFDRFVRPRCPNSTVWSFSQDQLVQIQEERRDVAVASSWRVAGLKKTMKHSMNGIRIPKGGRIHSCWVGDVEGPRNLTSVASRLGRRSSGLGSWQECKDFDSVHDVIQRAEAGGNKTGPCRVGSMGGWRMATGGLFS